MKHTPKPWDIGRFTRYANGADVDIICITAEPKKLKSGIVKVKAVCEIKVKKNGEANAKLIAAAPDLLEALEIALNYVGNVDDLNKIKAAINKATK